MSVIIDNDDVTVSHDKQFYKLTFRTPQHALVQSLLKTRIISGASTDETYKTVYFKADKVQSLRAYQDASGVRHAMRVADVSNMVRCLATQLAYLIDHTNHTILGYSPDNIVVVNEDRFIFVGSDLVVEIDEDTQEAMVCCPFSPTDFLLSPEMREVTELPSLVHYKSSYFSLGLLMMYVLRGGAFYKDYIEHRRTGDELLATLRNHPIRMTKLFWLLSRCLVKDPRERSIILL